LPQRVQDAVAAWPSAATDEQRLDLERRFGPFDTDTLYDLTDAADDFQNVGKQQEAMQGYQLCSWYAQRAKNYLRASICLQLIGGLERLQGSYVEAEKHYREAMEWADHPGADHRIPFVLNNLGGIYVAQARYAEAIDTLSEAQRIFARDGKPPDPAAAQNRGVVYGLQGDMAKSLEQFLIALRLYEEKKDERKIALTHYNIGILQSKQANYEEAESEIETALGIYSKFADRPHEAQALSDLGRVRDLQGKPGDALDLMTRGAAVLKEVKYKSAYGEALINLGDFHQSHGNWTAAKTSYEEARGIFEELGDGNDLGLALRGLGFVAIREKRNADAAKLGELALKEATRIGDIEGQWKAEALCGMAARAEGDRATARAQFVRSIDIIERQRGVVAGGEVEKQRFFEQAAYPYEELALLSADEGGFAALQAAERTRARTLLDVMGTAPDQLEQFLSADERTEEKRFRASLSGLNARISKAPAAQLGSLVHDRDDLWHSYQSFLEGVYVRNPSLRTWNGSAPLLSEADVAVLAKEPDAALVEYMCATEETLVFLITRDGIQLARIPVGQLQMGEKTAHLRQLLEDRDPGFRAEARALYNLLLAPIARGLRQKKHVWLIPDGPLWQMPFQALISPAGKYWIEDSSIAFAPSLTFLREKRKQPASPVGFSKDLVAFGDPARVDTPSIPGLRDQVRQIAALYDPARTEIRVGAAAAEKPFRESAPTARVIHIAAHGIVDERNALHSRILLAGGSGGDVGNDDGWVEAWELMRMGLHADLAVLSACESGRGQIAEGEGLVGLTWALFVSGVRTSVVSQWRVESESASALMVAMHKRLRNGQRPSVALRGAMLEVMKDERFRHPMYWAAFVPVGVDAALGN
jgi:CHAT domain-containing protein